MELKRAKCQLGMELDFMRLFFLLFYGGPDQLIPLASIIGVIIGFLLLVWQRFVGLAMMAYKFVMQKLGLTKKL